MRQELPKGDLPTLILAVLALIQLFSSHLQYPMSQQIIFAAGFVGSMIVSTFCAWLAIRWRANQQQHGIAR